jgi:hypothetical protein
VTDAELQELKTLVHYLKDRQDILDCLAREARGRDRHDAELTAGCFWEDGLDEHGRSVLPGPEYGEKANLGHAAKFAANSHNLCNHLCELEGDVANCETYVVGALLSPDEASCKIAIGRYIDRLERRGGEWRIKLRRVTIESVCEGDASWLRHPNVSGLLKGLRSRDDPSYRRPIEIAAGDVRW